MRLSSVVIPKLGNEKGVLMNFIDYSVLVINPSRPVSGKSMFQWFWLANALKRFTSDNLYEGIDSAKYLFISFLPV